MTQITDITIRNYSKAQIAEMETLGIKVTKVDCFEVKFDNRGKWVDCQVFSTIEKAKQYIEDCKAQFIGAFGCKPPLMHKIIKRKTHLLGDLTPAN